MQTEMLATKPDLKQKRNWTSWIASGFIHVVAFSALIALHTSSDLPVAAQRQEIFTPLVYRVPQIKVNPQHPPVTKIPVALPRPEVKAPPARILVLKEVPQINREQPRPAVIDTPQPVLQAAIPDVQVARLKAPDLPSRPAPPPAPVKTGMFENPGENPAGHSPAPRLEVQTGSFGDGSGGVMASANNRVGNSSGNGVHTGAFGDSATSNGTGPRPGYGKSTLVSNAGFGDGAAPITPAPRRLQATVAETPVEVLWKPKPVYTSEARSKKLEGKVTLEVVFRATGDIQVLRVVRGLGYGLDESARSAAEQIRFRPGKKDGVPVDGTGLVVITFELS